MVSEPRGLRMGDGSSASLEGTTMAHEAANINILKVKSETLEKFREFKALVENQSSRKIRALRSDNGGEYNSEEINEFYQKARI